MIFGTALTDLKTHFLIAPGTGSANQFRLSPQALINTARNICDFLRKLPPCGDDMIGMNPTCKYFLFESFEGYGDGYETVL